MAVINILDKHTAELIAAGEVVERPASVIKELVENSIDAGATQITVRIIKGGIELLEVQDNGEGIEPEYIPNAFIRHATSKIKTEIDLDNIGTLGFRGEALASIASVAKVSMLTKTQDNDDAFCYEIHGGIEKGMYESARPVGTTITVKNIFYNTPARMKFLKKDTSEGNYISDIVMKLALSHPEISFKFIRDEKEIFSTTGDDNWQNTICEVLSRDFGKELIAIDFTQNNMTLKGFITSPHKARGSRSMQYFYVNDRYVKNQTMMAALEQGYKGTMMQGRFPGCVLSLEMPYDKVDVNVHPAKTQIRFANEKEIFDIVYVAIKSALSQNSMEKLGEFTHLKTNVPIIKEAKKEAKKEVVEEKPTIEVKTDTSFDKNSFASSASVRYDYESDNTVKVHTLKPKVNIDIEYDEPIKKKEPIVFTEIKEPIIEETKEVIKEVVSQQVMENFAVQETFIDRTPYMKLIGEIFKTYIIVQYGEELCLIDKHAAHERIIYEKLMESYGNIASQQLLAPISVTMSAQEKNAVIENKDVLFDLGIEIDDFGGNSVMLRSVPSDIEVYDVESMLTEIASKLSLNIKNAMSEKTQMVLHSVACKSAIKANDHNQNLELMSLAKKVMNGEVPLFCPHGRPILLKMSKKEIEKQFGRLG